jgi:hypothetical protein
MKNNAHPGSSSIRRSATTGDRVAVLQRAALQDQRLSYVALGVLARVLSRPRDWCTSADRLAAESPKEGRKAVQAALRELEACGYLHRTRTQGKGGQWGWDWVISDEADTPDPGPEAPETPPHNRRSQTSPQVTPKVPNGTSVNRPSVSDPSLKGSRPQGSREQAAAAPPRAANALPKVETSNPIVTSATRELATIETDPSDNQPTEHPDTCEHGITLTRRFASGRFICPDCYDPDWDDNHPSPTSDQLEPALR